MYHNRRRNHWQVFTLDPITQGAVGAALAQSTARGKQTGSALLAGWLGGMAADLDVLIRSSTDPLLFLEYHRHFSHALVFIPAGGLIVALFVHYCFGKQRSWAFKSTLLFCTAGYATHGLLDGCTSYGTQLLWPFTDKRYAWDNISIVDPLLTLPIIFLLIRSARRATPWPARIAVMWGLSYLGFGLFQQDRAILAGEVLANSRGHFPEQVDAKPGFGNLLLFKTIYRLDGRFYVDAVRVGSSVKHYPGGSIPILDRERDLPWLLKGSQQYADLDRFDWFSQGFVALHPDNPLEVIDVRYSMLPNRIDPMWGIELSKNASSEQHALYSTHRNNPSQLLGRYWQMVIGE